ncbi:hypothetical protein [Stakelama pacifica]|uniref:Transmembrane protein n=1 Tax=Stakelama pacifica TaxID=517720 RepID=A0A4R6FPP5_9SPHN|nr:hypothetical protein [Stakelama pacifica]TDN83583.1 hypothetical protein EV664_10466 [Stakelama pacifica]GGO94239.1 hypothetical protein GCM10011329_15550 [Stakelama pacifica]
MVVAEEEIRPPRIGPAVALYVFSLFGGVALHKGLDLHGWVLVPIYAVPIAALGWMIVQKRRMRAVGAAGCSGGKAYQRRILGLALAYMALLMLANWLNSQFALHGIAAVLVALLPALPLIGMILAIGRLIIDEKDEYLRVLHVRQMLVATGFMLSVCSIWGFLESFDQVPHVPAYWAFVIWCGGLALGTLYNEMRP